MVLTTVDQRRVQYSALGPNDVVVAVAIDYDAAIRNILQVLTGYKPHCDGGRDLSDRTILERGGRPRSPSHLKSRIKFTWYDTLVLRRHTETCCGTLPPNSAIFWELMIVDAAGVVHEEGTALKRLHAVANAPIFSYTDAFFGQEIVGGPHVPVLEAGRQVAAVAIRILSGENPATIKVPPVGMGTPKFDWREMQRWGNQRKPAAGRQRESIPKPDDVGATPLQSCLGALAAVLIQALIILWLLYEHRRRHRPRCWRAAPWQKLQNVNRLAAAGELSASIAHEVKQPLGGGGGQCLRGAQLAGRKQAECKRSAQCAGPDNNFRPSRKRRRNWRHGDLQERR